MPASDAPGHGLGGVPRWVAVVAVAGALLVLIPLAGIVSRVDWGEFLPLISSPSSLDALWLSIRTSFAATALCLLLGVPLALVLARVRFPGRQALRALVLLPLVLPPVVGGLALLYAFGRRGLLGGFFELFGVQIAFTSTAVVLAQTFVSLPFLVLSLEGALRSAGTRYERVAATLGAGPTRTLVRVTLPLVLPALVSGTVLSFARSLGEFGATLTFAGSLQGITRTLPLEVYLQRETDPAAASALSLLLVVVALLVVLFAHRTGEGSEGVRGRRRFRRGSASTADDGGPDRDGASPASSAEGRPGAPARAPGPLEPPLSGSPARAGRPPAPSLELEAVVAQRDVDVAVRLPAGAVLALMGANGSGKSTVLAVAAGLLRPQRGLVRLGERSLVQTGGKRIRWVPAHRRRVGLLAQEPLLFPHMTVLENVAFGPRSSGARGSEARAIARRWLAEVGAEELAERRPGELSGGQAQRVAIARALAAEPELLLLDEPMAALDVAARSALRGVLRRVLAGRSAIVVTHDVLDALSLADRLILLGAGRVRVEGPVREVLDRPGDAFAARLAGLNLLTGTATEAGVRLADGTELAAAVREAEPGVPAALVVRPAEVALSLAEAGEGGRFTANELLCRVQELEPYGDAVRVRTDRIAADLAPGEAAALTLQPGDRVRCSFTQASARSYPL